MRFFDRGSSFGVQVTEREVMAFKRKWPASGLPNRGMTFWFDKKSGDLIDYTPYGILQSAGGGGAAIALVDDAKAYGFGRLGQAVKTGNPAMSMREFIRSNRDELDAGIRRALGDPDYCLNDKEREQWVLNDEGLYWWARREGVRI